MAHPHQEFPGVSPKTVVKIFHKLEWHIYYLLYSRFGKYREEEDWIFNTQKLADAWKKKSAKSQSGPAALLSFIMFLQTNVCFHVHPPPLSAGDLSFSRVLSGLVKSLTVLLNRHTQQKASGIQVTSACICHNRFLDLSYP